MAGVGPVVANQCGAQLVAGGQECLERFTSGLAACQAAAESSHERRILVEAFEGLAAPQRKDRRVAPDVRHVSGDRFQGRGGGAGVVAAQPCRGVGEPSVHEGKLRIQPGRLPSCREQGALDGEPHGIERGTRSGRGRPARAGDHHHERHGEGDPEDAANPFALTHAPTGPRRVGVDGRATVRSAVGGAKRGNHAGLRSVQGARRRSEGTSRETPQPRRIQVPFWAIPVGPCR